MAWYPGAARMELQPESDAQAAIRPTQLIVHSIAAPWSPGRIYEYWRDSTNLESHFGLGYDGSLGQFIGTETRADANAQANRRPDGTGAVSIETASNLKHTDAWTGPQIAVLIQLGVWMHQRHGVPLRVCRSASDPGFGYHRLFAQWSVGGTACPGDARVAQFRDVVFPGIVNAAGGGAPQPGGGQPATPVVVLRHLLEAVAADIPAPTGHTTYPGYVELVEWALEREGLLERAYAHDGSWGTRTRDAYAAWQRRCGYSGSDADGVPGKTSLTRLGARHGFTVVD